MGENGFPENKSIPTNLISYFNTANGLNALGESRQWILSDSLFREPWFKMAQCCQKRATCRLPVGDWYKPEGLHVAQSLPHVPWQDLFVKGASRKWNAGIMTTEGCGDETE